MLNFLPRTFRFFKIFSVLSKHGLDQIVLNIPWFYPFRFLMYLNPFNWRRQDNRLARGIRIRLALEELGPIFVKFGQLLSTRRDLIPTDIADELASLQDKVPPFSQDAVIPIIEKAFNQSVNELFLEFDIKPLASASIAQVHRASLPDGTAVVVKILRPHIERTIKRDINLLYTFATLLQKYWRPAKRIHPVEVVNKFETTIMDELDLSREAANGSQLRRNFSNSHLLYIPEIYWPYVKTNVLVMEEIHGIPVSDITRLTALNIDLKLLAERGVEIFFNQVFKDCFFHADMHPGNIFVSPNHPESPQYIAVDFGIVGTLNRTDQRYLAENLLAFFRRDYRRVAELHVQSGWVSAHTRIEDLESAIRTVCEPIFDKPLKDISIGQLLIRLFHIAKRFDMEVQPQLLLLQKTLIHVEGLGRQLYPELDLWQTAKPFLESWLKNQVGPIAFMKNIRDNAPFWIERLPELPDLLYDVLKTQRARHHAPKQLLEPYAPPPGKQRLLASFLFGNTLTLSVLGAGFLFVFSPNQLLSDHPLRTLCWVSLTVLSGLIAYVIK